MRKWYSLILLSLILWACSAGGEEQTFEPTINPAGPEGEISSSSNSPEQNSSSSISENSWMKSFEWKRIPKASLARGTAVSSVDSFLIASTEVTQGVYQKVIGTLPKQEYAGEEFPIENVSWYQAALFCNAYAKLVGLDTAYKYSAIQGGGVLTDLTIDYYVKTIRMPTETEWEIAARGGTSTTYYWNTDAAANYAYYAQTKGPVKVGQYTPNAYGLYDMGGNVAEWVNDWYKAYPNLSQENPTGPDFGEYRCVRGGGWTDKVSALASSERNKKNPQYTSAALGFRVVYTEGFSK